MKKIGMISLGCPKNLVDTEVMLGLARQEGFEIVAEEEAAEILLINTCCFIKAAEDESVAEIIAASKKRQRGKINALIICGCLPKRYKKELTRRFPQVDHFLDTSNFNQLPEILKTMENDNLATTPLKKQLGSYLYDHLTPRVLASGNYFAYSKIAEGCSRSCSYCIIPKLRGRLKSRTITSLLAEASSLEEKGVKELNLIAQDLTAYGNDLGQQVNLYQLLNELEKNSSPAWIRLLYNYPENFSEKLIEFIAGSKKVLPYLDLPLQHCSDKILTAMRRQVTKRQISSLLNKLREKINNLTLRTTLLVGFPQESEKDFLELCDFVKEQQFEHLGVFPYSQEMGTPAAKMPGQLPEAEKIARAEEIMTIQQEVVQQKQQHLKSKEVSLLVLGPSGDPNYPYYGRAVSQAPEIDGLTLIKTKEDSLGKIISAKIKGFSGFDILAARVN